MKVDHASDLHVNHWVPFNHNQLKWEKQTKEWTEKLLQTGSGDILVLAGDFSEWNAQTLWVLEEASKHYKHVLFVTGNHDRYLLSKKQRNKYGMSSRRVEELIDNAVGVPNVTPLAQSIVTIGDKRIAGDGLWYKLETPADVSFYQTQSNDSQYIWEGVAPIETPEKLYQEAMAWYQTLQEEPIDLMVSHIPPLHPPISPNKRNACYDCPVPFLVAPKWISGHQHIQGSFYRAGTDFHMNAIGYPSEKGEQRLHQFIL